MKLKTQHILVLFLAICCFASFPAVAQEELSRLDKITKTQANQFFEKCMEQKYPANSTESKQMFCACSSARFFEQLRQGDVQDLRFEDTWQARLAKEKVLLYVYTPCIKSSMEDLLREECELSTYLEDYPYISKRKYCACQNKRMTLLFNQKFGTISQMNKARLDESISDPISSFMQNSLFQAESATVTSVCMKNATVKLKKPKQISPHPAPLIPQHHDHDDHSDHDH